MAIARVVNVVDHIDHGLERAREDIEGVSANINVLIKGTFSAPTTDKSEIHPLRLDGEEAKARREEDERS